MFFINLIFLLVFVMVMVMHRFSMDKSRALRYEPK